MRIKRFHESISGTELVGNNMGPNYGYPKTPVTLTGAQTSTLLSEIDGRFYVFDDYQSLYQEYLKIGGTPLRDGFTKENLDRVILFISDKSEK